MISILSNVPSLRAGNELSALNKLVEESAARLATGKRILSAADDPAGVGILSSLKAQAASFVSVDRNIASGIGIVQTAGSALDTQQEILSQMKDLATQASSDILTADQRSAISQTFVELQGQLDNAVNSATLFGQNLVGSSAKDVSIQSGISAGDTFNVTSAQSDAATLGVEASNGEDGSVSTASGTFADVTITGDTTASTYTLSITDADGVDVDIASFSDASGGTTVTAADIDEAIAAATLPDGVTVTGTAAEGTLNFSRADGSAFTVKETITSGTGASAAVSGDGFADTFSTAAGVETAADTAATGISLDSVESAQAAMAAIDLAVTRVATNQSILGAQQNGLEAISRNVTKVSENIEGAISRIEDVDVAKETAQLSLLQSRLQFSTSVLTLINQFPSQALSLLR